MSELIVPPPIVTTLVFGQGPAGPPGSAGARFEHLQSSPLTTWIVNHNFGYRPAAVTALSVGGVLMLAEVLHASVNQALIYFDSPIAGSAICS